MVYIKNLQVLSEEFICNHKGQRVVLQQIKDTEPPAFATYCVHYAGNGHYFKNKDDAEKYLASRKFKRK